MDKNFKNHIITLLLKDDRVKDEQGELKGNLVKEFVNTLDENLITILLEDEKTRAQFFLKIKDSYVFKTNEFKFFLDENSIDNSFTQYSNQIGLSSGGKFLKDNTDVVLNFPFKDCVLEGGQSTEDGLDTYFEDDGNGDYTEKQSKRKEIFFNEVLAKDEIDRLLEPKAFTNITKYDSKGESKPTKFNRNEKGTITDNLIIKGNNLLALHSLKQEFKGKVKLIYIDPPYNTGNDSFAYNDNLNHSTWLTFMRNRLMVARDLLSEDGFIFVNIDDNQQGYLSILMNEIFEKVNRYDKVSVKTSSSQGGFGDVNPGYISNTENILIYSISKKLSNFEEENLYVQKDYDENYTQIIINKEEPIENWKFENLNNIVYRQEGISEPYNNQTWRRLKESWGNNWKQKRFSIKSTLAFQNKNFVFRTFNPNKPAKYLKEALDISKKNKNKVIEAISTKSDVKLCLNGEVIAFYSNIFKTIDNESIPATRLSTFWDDISWEGIANEGGVKLNNGKKPEKLIRRIINSVTKEKDIILDYHLGSGTTAAVAHKMNRQYIGLEQIDNQIELSKKRLNNVINNDQSGISKTVNWKGGGSFTYLELAKNNQTAKEEILKCKNLEELLQFFETMYTKYFLHYNVRIKEFKEVISQEENFKNLALDRQKEIFSKMLDLNQLYVNLSEIEDSRYKLDAKDIGLSKDFYQKNK
jgi:adenine-specific DNA-methyltransferase